MLRNILGYVSGIAAVFILAPVLVLLFFIFACILVPVPAGTADARYSLWNGHPTDQQLTDNYLKYKADFDALAKMMDSESEIGGIDKDSCYIPNEKKSPATSKRCDEYKRILKSIGLLNAYTNRDPDVLEVSSSGLGISGSEKGYFYTKQAHPTPPSSEYHNLRQMDGHWWIYDFST